MPVSNDLIFTDVQTSDAATLRGREATRFTDVVQKNNSPGVSLKDVRSWIDAEFSARFQSTGPTANLAQTRKLVELTDASPANPYLLRFDQVILEAFAGGDPAAQFDLVERDPTDVDVFEPDGSGGFTKVSGGESEVVLATKTGGFTDGDTTGSWSRFVKVITSNKFYKIVFAPGSAGDGVYSIKVIEINRS
jgi:hypothetical protein